VEAEGFPRHHPPAVASSLLEAASLGFAVMSGSPRRIAPAQGNFRYPTRNFATLGPFDIHRVATGLDHLFTGLQDKPRCLAYGL